MKYDVSNMAEGLLINTKIDIIAVSGGLSAAVTFVSIYLGIIFLICSAAILALKELSDSSSCSSSLCVWHDFYKDRSPEHGTY